MGVVVLCARGAAWQAGPLLRRRRRSGGMSWEHGLHACFDYPSPRVAQSSVSAPKHSVSMLHQAKPLSVTHDLAIRNFTTQRLPGFFFFFSIREISRIWMKNDKEMAFICKYSPLRIACYEIQLRACMQMSVNIKINKSMRNKNAITCYLRFSITTKLISWFHLCLSFIFLQWPCYWLAGVAFIAHWYVWL